MNEENEENKMDLEINEEISTPFPNINFNPNEEENEKLFYEKNFQNFQSFKSFQKQNPNKSPFNYSISVLNSFNSVETYEKTPNQNQNQEKKEKEKEKFNKENKEEKTNSNFNNISTTLNSHKNSFTINSFDSLSEKTGNFLINSKQSFKNIKDFENYETKKLINFSNEEILSNDNFISGTGNNDSNSKINEFAEKENFNFFNFNNNNNFNNNFNNNNNNNYEDGFNFFGNSQFDEKSPKENIFNIHINAVCPCCINNNSHYINNCNENFNFNFENLNNNIVDNDYSKNYGL